MNICALPLLYDL